MIKYLFGAKINENNGNKIWFTRYRYYDKIDKIDVSAWEAGDLGKNKNPQHFKKLTEIDLNIAELCS